MTSRAGLLAALVFSFACKADPPSPPERARRTVAEAAPAPRPAPVEEREPAPPRAPVAPETEAQPPAPAPVEAPPVASPPPPPAQEPLPDLDDLFPADRRITLELPEASLGEVLRLLANAAGVNLIVAEGLDRRLSVSLKEVSLQDALRTVFRGTDLRLVRQGDVLFVERKPEPEATRPALASRTFRVDGVDPGTLESPLRSILGEGGEVLLGGSGGTIFLRGEPARLAEAVAFLESVERREEQVVIEARLYEVGFQRDQELGSALDLLDISVDDTTGMFLSNFLTPATNFTVSWSNDNGLISGAVRALDRIASVDLLSAPRVAVLDGREATIEIIERIPYVQATTTFDVASGGSTTASIQSIEFEEVGITLKCTPTIREDGLVRLVVTPTVSNVTDFVQGVPVVDRRTLTTEVYVRDGGTLYLGGLLQEVEREEIHRIPILGHIPLLGALFRSTERIRTKLNLLILLTPRVVDLDAAPPGVGESYREEFDRNREGYPGPRRDP